MHLLLPILGTLALAGAAFLTLMIAGATGFFTMRKPSGPDAMALAGPFLAGILCWALLALAAGIAAGRGSLQWITDSTPAAVILAFVTVAGIGGAAVAGIAVSFETRHSFRTGVGLLAGLVLPAIVAMFIAALLWTPPLQLARQAWPRVFLYPLAAISLAAWVTAFVFYLRHLAAQERRAVERAKELERQYEQNREDAKKRDIEHAAQLAAMPDDAPLAEFLTHLFIDKSEEHHARAMARISSLPDVRNRIEATLADPVPLQREYCANYIRNCPGVDAALAPAVGHAILLLAEDIERAAPTGDLRHAVGMTQGILMTAEKFTGVRFDEEAKKLRAALEKWPHESSRVAALAAADRYLKGEPVDVKG